MLLDDLMREVIVTPIGNNELDFIFAGEIFQIFPEVSLRLAAGGTLDIDDTSNMFVNLRYIQRAVRFQQNLIASFA